MLRQRGKVVSSFVLGSRKLYDFIHDNPSVELRESSYVNDTETIRVNPKVTAINNAGVRIAREVAQDKAFSLVYGMPRVAFESGAVAEQVAVELVAQLMAVVAPEDVTPCASNGPSSLRTDRGVPGFPLAQGIKFGE